MELIGSSIPYIFPNFFGYSYEGYRKLFGLEDTPEEKEKFLEYCKLYKQYYDAIGR